MKNRILVAGCTALERECLRDGQYQITGKKYLSKLYKNFSIDNLSKDSLTSGEALKLISAFSDEYSYSCCLLALGEGDIREKTSLAQFRENLLSILSLLKEKGLKPILFSLPAKIEKKYREYQDVITELRNSFHLESIFDMAKPARLSMAK